MATWKVLFANLTSVAVLTTKELLAEMAKTRTTEHEGSDAALSILHVVFEGVGLQSMRYVSVRR